MSSNNTAGEMEQSKIGDDIAICVSNLSKVYQIYDRPEDRLKQSIYPRIQKWLGHQPRSYHREFWALKDVSFKVRKGETVGIIGRNGAGKSTLLQMVCGTLNPSSGTIEVNGRVAALLELGSGFNPEFTGRENVYMNASILGLSQQQIDAKFSKIMAFSEIADFIDQPVKSYSSGMLVRLAFSVIAHVDADILIIDEALAVGDAFFTQKCMRFLRNFMKTGTILFVSHDTGAVLNLCNKAVSLNCGSIASYGKPKDVVKRYLGDDYGGVKREAPKEEESQTKINETESTQLRDMRQDFINQTTLRNDIEIFDFSSEGESFGIGGASISNVQFCDEADNPLSHVVGGENVKITIEVKALVDLISPIVGFQLKDRLGQVIFSDNSYITYNSVEFNILAGEKFKTTFEFTMPVLPVGDYSVSSALAVGTQAEHIQHHWIHDAIILKSMTSSICLGLVGIPMKKIEMKIEK